MDENQSRILRESGAVASRLQVLARFFEDDDVYRLYLRTQVIHQLFEHNESLDVSKLELFHLQFSSTTIELLKRIKKGNEQNLTVLFDEIQINRDLIEKLQGDLSRSSTFEQDQKNQALKMDLSLRRLYEELSSGGMSENPFSRNIMHFSSRYAEDFYQELDAEVASQALVFKTEDVYTHPFAIIQRKLMGILCKFDFKTRFLFGFRSGSIQFETYGIVDSERNFLFQPSRNLLLFTDAADLEKSARPSSAGRKGKMLNELQDANTRLESRLRQTRTFMPPDIKALLVETYDKISNLSFLENLSNVDAQANILKTMLNTDSL